MKHETAANKPCYKQTTLYQLQPIPIIRNNWITIGYACKNI